MEAECGRIIMGGVLQCVIGPLQSTLQIQTSREAETILLHIILYIILKVSCPSLGRTKKQCIKQKNTIDAIGKLYLIRLD